MPKGPDVDPTAVSLTFLQCTADRGVLACPVKAVFKVLWSTARFCFGLYAVETVLIPSYDALMHLFLAVWNSEGNGLRCSLGNGKQGKRRTKKRRYNTRALYALALNPRAKGLKLNPKPQILNIVGLLYSLPVFPVFPQP